jgi:hypothetical protein
MMVEFLSGVVTCAYLVAAGLFFVLWRKSADALFRALSGAFVLFALNQVLAAALVTTSDPSSMVYALRVLGFVIVVGALLGSEDARRESMPDK